MKPQVTVGLGARKKKMKKKLRMRERPWRRRRSTVAGELARQDKPIHSPKWVPVCKCWWAVSFGVVCVVSWFVDLVCCWLSILWPLYLVVQLVPHGSWLSGWIGGLVVDLITIWWWSLWCPIQWWRIRVCFVSMLFCCLFFGWFDWLLWHSLNELVGCLSNSFYSCVLQIHPKQK